MSAPEPDWIAAVMRGWMSLALMVSSMISAPSALPASTACRFSSTSAAGMKSTQRTMWSFVPWAHAGARPRRQDALDAGGRGHTRGRSALEKAAARQPTGAGRVSHRVPESSLAPPHGSGLAAWLRHSERRLCRHNPSVGGGLGGAVEAPSDYDS